MKKIKKELAKKKEREGSYCGRAFVLLQNRRGIFKVSKVSFWGGVRERFCLEMRGKKAVVIVG